MATVLLGLFRNGMVSYHRCLLPLPNAHFVPPFWDGKGMVVCMWQRNGPAQPNRALPFEPELSVLGCEHKSGELFPIGWILYEEARYLHM